MPNLLCLLAIFLPADDQHSIASKVLGAIVVEVEVIESHALIDPVTAMLEMKVRDVGLGAESLKGKNLKATYGIGLERKKPVPGFTPLDGKPLIKGTVLVVALGGIGTNREAWIKDAWAKGEKKPLETGTELIAKLKEVNDAKGEEELADRIFYTLRKENAATDFLWGRLGLGTPFARKETLMSLLQRVIECEQLPEERRNLIKDTLKRNQPAWAASDELRHEMILRITSGDKRTKIVPATISFANAIRNQKEAKVAQNWCDNLCGVALEMEGRSPEESAAFIEAIQGVLYTNTWTEPFNDQLHLLWKTAFRMEAESKQEAVKSAWQDMLVEKTSQGAPFVKKEVLSRLDDIKDATFRERLRNAATADAKQVEAPPRKP